MEKVVIEITGLDNKLYGCKRCGVVFMDSHNAFWHKCDGDA